MGKKRDNIIQERFGLAHVSITVRSIMLQVWIISLIYQQSVSPWMQSGRHTFGHKISPPPPPLKMNERTNKRRLMAQPHEEFLTCADKIG